MASPSELQKLVVSFLIESALKITSDSGANDFEDTVSMLRNPLSLSERMNYL